MTPVRTAARAMLAAIFVAGGSDAILNPERLVPRAKPVTDRVAPLLTQIHPKLPTEARTMVQVNGAVQVVGGLLLLTPARRVAALALAGSLIPTTLAGHAFWNADNPADRAAQRIQFFKNTSLFGGLVLAALDNDGRPGIRWRVGHLAHSTNRSVRRGARNAKSKANIAMKAASAGRHLPG